MIARDTRLVGGKVNERQGIGQDSRATAVRDIVVTEKGSHDPLAWAQIQGYVKAFRKGFV